ncbi:interferon-inducible double-stranded RNA-dependent protein kinase activator A homolog [Actinia tenebrosa]|uniref:Interferon-inducible double-stranded RNA-dependent protein kinase activator A homolog n=1 Tax=Actinia tenebrosa TaxID=6105 RepID=A0A6P8HKT0_ACTTE|nr:interferon-inducible double-stranded RNA-dependent protein kinase activator A homolog [Actinia tenebrosa]
MASTTPAKLGETIRFLENVGMHQDSIDLLMLASSQHSMIVRFKNLVEDASQKTFICKVEIGGLLDECIGYGQSKREAKINAADDAIAKLTDYVKVPKPREGTPQEEPSSSRRHETDVTTSMNESPSYRSSYPRSLSLPENTNNLSLAHNSVGELQELAMQRGWPAPEYKEIDEYGEPHRMTFLIECKLKHNVCEGRGSSKKTAKKQAAEKMLKMVQPSVSSGPFISRNLSTPGLEQRDSPRASVSTAAIMRTRGKEPPISSIPLEKMKISSSETNRRPQNFYCNKLSKEAKKNSWNIEWKDLGEKGYNGNYQCFVQISTDPMTVCCGSGPTLSSAHDDAAMNALNCLKE